MPWLSLLKRPHFKLVILMLLTTGLLEPAAIINHREGDKVFAHENGANRKKSTMRLMTFNIRHAKGLDGRVHLDRIIEEILIVNPDIISLQEVDRYNIRSGFRDQVKEIGDALGMAWAFSPSLKLGWMQYGNAVLSKYPIQSSQMFVLPSDKELRTILQVDIQAGEKTLRVLNTHLGVSERDRQGQMPLLMKLIEEVQGPTILMGDFNMEIDHPLMAAIKGSWQKAAESKATVLGGAEIDHIFHNTNGSAINAWTIPTEASDHLPVIVDMVWNGY